MIQCNPLPDVDGVGVGSHNVRFSTVGMMELNESRPDVWWCQVVLDGWAIGHPKEPRPNASHVLAIIIACRSSWAPCGCSDKMKRWCYTGLLLFNLRRASCLSILRWSSMIIGASTVSRDCTVEKQEGLLCQPFYCYHRYPHISWCFEATKTLEATIHSLFQG